MQRDSNRAGDRINLPGVEQLHRSYQALVDRGRRRTEVRKTHICADICRRREQIAARLPEIARSGSGTLCRVDPRRTRPCILNTVYRLRDRTLDDRVFELPVGFSERLHKRIDLEFMRIAP